MINHQPIEKPVQHPNGALDVIEIFDTIQGEGPYAGMPATFIRLAGCNLNCSLCDTDYTTARSLMIPAAIQERVQLLPRRDLVVLTGGEPLRQDLKALVQVLTINGRRVQIETNGTLPIGSLADDSLVEKVCIVCSPKTPRIDHSMWDHIDALKYVVKHGQVDEYDGLPLSSVGPQYGRPARPPWGWSGDVYVQPLDEQDEEKNKLNNEVAAKSCLLFGYRLCLQMHKIVNLP